MFTDAERNELIVKLLKVLEDQKAGKAADREALAGLLADTTREFLTGKYNAGNTKKGKTGIVTLKDALRDIGRKM